MPGRMTAIGALLTVLALAGLAASRAQTPAGPAMEHRHPGGHEMGSQPGFHRGFDDAERWARQFDDPARDAWQKPDEVLDALQLERTARVADLGAGTGYFTARIAKRVPDGKLFAVDIAPDMVRYLGERSKREHLDMVVPVLASAESPNLPEPVDLILVVDTYHHIDGRVAYFSSLSRSLRPGGRLAIVDFRADSPNGPPPEHRIPPETVIAELAAAGYSLMATHQFLPRQYFLVFRGKAP